MRLGVDSFCSNRDAMFEDLQSPRAQLASVVLTLASFVIIAGFAAPNPHRERPRIVDDLIAAVSIALGIVLMLLGVVLGTEDWSDVRPWSERKLAKLVFFAGATIAVGGPLVGYAVGKWIRRERKPNS